MNVLNDLHQDQIILNHPSRGWATPLLKCLHPILCERGWTCVESNNIFYSSYTKAQENLIISLVHPPTTIPTYFIGDSVTTLSGFGLYPEVFGIYKHKFDYIERPPNKLFNCFMHRGCPFRQSWFYFLERHNLLAQGHVSFWCEDRVKNTAPAVYFEQMFQTHNRLMFQKEHDQTKDNIPFKNFAGSLEDSIMDSAISLVIETFFEPNQKVTYSEKTWRALQMPRPMLLFGSQHSIKYLREWGFDVYDEIVDHSYDEVSDKFVRQQMILTQLQKSIKYDPELFTYKARHNANLLDFYQQQWPNKYKNLLEFINRISNTESFTLRT
jgi:hypothetical protein